ncbi:MAG TPA: hypothetical protein VNU44_14645 [Bryobacteraceae bacterium]|nr:hypothetical protein [Bryobacteraceae bacterium]
MRRLSIAAMLLAATSVLVPAPARAQASGTFTGIPFGPYLPAVCNPGVTTGVPLFFLNTVQGGNAVGLYQCASPNTWTPVGGLGVTGCTTTGGVAFENGTPNALTCSLSLSFGGGQLNISGFAIATNVSSGGATGSGTVYTLASAGNASAGLTTYTGLLGTATISPGMYVTIAGFTNGVNNGRFIVQAENNGLGTLVLYNASGVAESHAATATVDEFYSGSSGVTATQARSFQYGQPGTINSFGIRGANYSLSAFNATQPGSLSYGCALDGDATDGCYILVINNGATGDHGIEIGAITDGTGANPTAIRLGHFGGSNGMFSSIAGGTFFSLAQEITATSSAFATATTAGTCVQNVTAVTGATTGMAVVASPVSTPGAGAVWSAFVSSAGNVTINECAVATSAGGSIAFNIRVIP